MGDGGREPAAAAGLRGRAFALLLPLLVGLAEVAGVGLKGNVEGPGQRPQRDRRGRGELTPEEGGRWRPGDLLAEMLSSCFVHWTYSTAPVLMKWSVRHTAEYCDNGESTLGGGRGAFVSLVCSQGGP